MSKSVPIAHLRRNQDAAVRLPPPSLPKTYNELEPEVQDVFSLFLKIGVLERDETEAASDSDRFYAPRDVYAYAQQLNEDRPTLPCGHGGIRNPGDGVFTCTQDVCDAEFGQEEVQAYIDAAAAATDCD